jgi:hypothetical protein
LTIGASERRLAIPRNPSRAGMALPLN